MDATRGPCGERPPSVTLPVLPAMKHSPMGARRAAVLIAVNVLLVLHVVQWYFSRRTLAPLEPSEGMETLKEGVVNPGFIVLAVAILSTAVLGRWFCGWGCHIMGLQELCAWLLRKRGIRPHPFRSRLLLLLPLALALYMFAWPVVYRLAIAPFTRPELTWPGLTFRAMTDDFWKTFPGWGVGIPFLFICGFVAVYLLGSKAYCTYGCPYGGFLAPADRLARLRIRVDENCHQCGHCTAACTSNVRVHEEVRDFGMVVDPGCFKCLDCVHVCPNDALSVSWGRPATGVEAPAGHQPRRYDLTLGEDIALAALAVFVFFATRGAYGAVPLLFGSGITICVVFLCFKAWRTLREPNQALHGIQLRIHGGLRPAGVALIGVAALALALVAHTGFVNASFWLGERADLRVTISEEQVFTRNAVEMDATTTAAAEEALKLYSLASFIGDGGWGLLPTTRVHLAMRRAWLLCTLRRFDEARAELERVQELEGSESILRSIGRVVTVAEEPDAVARWYLRQGEEHPAYARLHDDFILWLAADGRDSDAIGQARLAVERTRGALDARRRLSLVLIEQGAGPREWREGVELVRQTIAEAPDNPFAYRALALGHARLEELPEAEAALAEAVRRAPLDPRLRRAHADVLEGMGRADEADLERVEALRLEGASGVDAHGHGGG